MKNAERGFTLAELLLGIAILVIPVTAILSLFISCLTISENNRNLVTAVSHAQFAIEELKNTSYANIVSAAWNSSDISSRGLNALNGETIVIAAGGNPRNIQVTVNWQDRGMRPRNVTLSTKIAEP